MAPSMPAIPPTDIQEVLRHVPHRFPFALVDAIEGGETGEWLRAVKHVSIDDPYFAHTGAGQRTMPSTLMVEALAQTGGILCLLSGFLKPHGASTTYLAAIDDTRVEREARAGESVVLECRLKRALRGVIRLKGRASIEGATCVEAVLTLVIRDTVPAAGEPRPAP